MKKVKIKEAKNKEKKAAKKGINWKSIGHDLLMVLWVGIACIAAQLIVGYPMLWILGKATFSTPVWTTVYSAITYILTAVLVILVPKLIKKEWGTTREQLGLTELPTFTDMGISVLGFVATIVAAGVILSVLQSLHLVDGGQAQDVGYSNLVNPTDRIVAFLALCVFAPVAEEIVFRGWLYGKLRRKNHVIVAVALVSILFGALHGQWNVGITVGIMSIIMCIEREFTGTIYAGILTHMIKNCIAFWILYVLM
jgi:membrane protease YdiL (CAAX protease family)